MRIALVHVTWPEQISGRSWQAMPATFRAAGFAGRLAAAGHDVDETVLEGKPTLKGAFVLAGEVAAAIQRARAAATLPVVVCGSCTIAAIGAVAALGPEAGIVWMDAHPDLNTPETTRSGLFEGMALAAATGHCWRAMAAEHSGLRPPPASNVVLFGARDIDPPEADLMARSNIAIAGSGHAIVDHVANRPSVYVHLDMDVHDALRFRANAFAVPGGPSTEDVGSALTAVARNAPVGALAFTGLEPGAADGATGIEIATAHALALAAAIEAGT